MADEADELPESEKRTHQSVHYEHPSRHKGQDCLRCEHFIVHLPPRCEGVKSPIRSEDWCQRFERKL